MVSSQADGCTSSVLGIPTQWKCKCMIRPGISSTFQSKLVLLILVYFICKHFPPNVRRWRDPFPLFNARSLTFPYLPTNGISWLNPCLYYSTNQQNLSHPKPKMPALHNHPRCPHNSVAYQRCQYKSYYKLLAYILNLIDHSTIHRRTCCSRPTTRAPSTSSSRTSSMT